MKRAALGSQEHREAADALFGGVSSGIFETNNLPQLAKFASLAALAKPNSLNARRSRARRQASKQPVFVPFSLSDTWDMKQVWI